MTKVELKLAAYFMELAADQFGNHGCNDLPEEVLAMLTTEQKQAFAKEFSEWNGDPENDREFDDLGDSSVMAFLAAKLARLAERSAGGRTE